MMSSRVWKMFNILRRSRWTVKMLRPQVVFRIVGDDDNGPMIVGDIQYFATIAEDDEACFRNCWG